MKVPGGCENLKAQAVGNAGLAKKSRCSGRESAEGVETSREALLVGVWCRPGVGFLENQKLKAAARCLGSL
jgi:hypothetical protein